MKVLFLCTANSCRIQAFLALPLTQLDTDALKAELARIGNL